MTSYLKTYTHTFLIIFFLVCSVGLAQNDTSTIKAQVAVGINSPSGNGFVTNFEGNSVNFPSINLGLQYMFKPLFGVKLDFGYNRFSNEDNTPEFKVNYSRINAQLVYNTSSVLRFLPSRVGTFVHAGPGFTMIKPLSNYAQNNTSYINAIVGIEFHYGVSDKLSIFVDASYIKGFSKDFDPITEGYGSFNGDLSAITVGVSISLSGCYYCEND